MKVEDDYCTFDELKSGELFRYQSSAWMKLWFNPSPSREYAVDLRNGCVGEFFSGTTVLPLDGKYKVWQRQKEPPCET